MNATGKRRLLKLADFLDTVRPERFNLRWWQGVDFSPRTCGTSACAVGWAVTMPAFKKEGLRSAGGLPLFARKEGWSAVCRFFHLEARQAYRLFMMGRYKTAEETPPGAVAKRIRDLVKRAARS